MTSEPVSADVAQSARDHLLLILGVAVAVAVITLAGYAWLDSRKTPTITFLATPDTNIAVETRGAVSTPGVIFLDPGSRMIDAVGASGGLTADADRSLINLSARVSDGQIIVIPTQSSGSGLSTDGLINVNTASVEELKQLPGIGEVLAQRIVAYREFNGPFQNSGELTEVEGVSASLAESLEPYITVTGDD